MRITLRDGEKPFMAYQTVATVAAFFRFGGVAQDIGSPCFSVIPMPISSPRFCPPARDGDRSDRSSAALTMHETV